MAKVDAYWRARWYAGPTPQSDPGKFSRAELEDEVRYLRGLERREGVHPLRVAAISRLLQAAAEATLGLPAKTAQPARKRLKEHENR
jgi:hypothetical protein